MGGDVAMGHFHVVEEGVNPKKLFYELVEVFGIASEVVGLPLEGLGKILHGEVEIGGGLDRLVDYPGILAEGGVGLLEVNEGAHRVGEREGDDSEDEYFVVFVGVTRPDLPVDVFAVELGGREGDDVVLDLLLEVVMPSPSLKSGGRFIYVWVRPHPTLAFRYF